MTALRGEWPPAVVLAADTNGLGALRSLYRAGIPSWALVTSDAEIAASSRLPRRLLRAAGHDSAALLAALELAPDGAVLIPTSDRFVSFIESNRETLSARFTLCVPPQGLGEILIDKAVETRRVAELGLAVPRTMQSMPATASELAAALRFPVIVKPRSFVHASALGRKNVILDTIEQAEALIERLGTRRDAVVVQEVIPGGDEELWVCNCTFDNDHQLLGAFTFQRLGLSPAHFGVTTLARSAHNLAVIEQVARLGLGLGYVGPAMVEFKRDPRDGRFYYLETNPRLGMCNWLDTVAGVNNVAMSYHVALGTADLPRVAAQREGIRYLNRLDDSWARRQDGDSWGSVFAAWRRSREAVSVGPYFASFDPWPAVVAVWRRVAEVGRAMKRKLLRSPS